MKLKNIKSRILLVLLGVSIGYAARFLLGPPADPDNGNQFRRPMPEPGAVDNGYEEIVLPLSGGSVGQIESGVVAPIKIPGVLPPQLTSEQALDAANLSNKMSFEHDENAEFEPHGEFVCASGCAASRHPTEELGTRHFRDLMRQFNRQPKNEDSPALEELLYYGPQTVAMIESEGWEPLSQDRANFLWDELKYTHAKISLRVVDEAGDIRTWLEPTRVPFDRRHVFEMETKNLQPLVTSGTVKRVGLNHLWVRL